MLDKADAVDAIMVITACKVNKPLVLFRKLEHDYNISIACNSEAGMLLQMVLPTL